MMAGPDTERGPTTGGGRLRYPRRRRRSHRHIWPGPDSFAGRRRARRGSWRKVGALAFGTHAGDDTLADLLYRWVECGDKQALNIWLFSEPDAAGQTEELPYPPEDDGE